MIAYAFALILAVGIPFLLYCLWNFSRELRPSRSASVLSSSSPHQVALSATPMSRFRSQPHTVQLRNQVAWPLKLDLFFEVQLFQDLRGRLFPSGT